MVSTKAGAANHIRLVQNALLYTKPPGFVGCPKQGPVTSSDMGGHVFQNLPPNKVNENPAMRAKFALYDPTLVRTCVFDASHSLLSGSASFTMSSTLYCSKSVRVASGRPTRTTLSLALAHPSTRLSTAMLLSAAQRMGRWFVKTQARTSKRAVVVFPVPGKGVPSWEL